MSNSSLVDVKVPAYSGNYTKGRSGKKIKKIAIHHMAGVLTAKECGKIFQKVGRKGSSHYGIGKNAEVGLYVDESNTAWTNSNWNSNCECVTIETSDCDKKWNVSDKVLNKLIELVADIARRNNLGKLEKGKNVVWHSMYANTNCPGAYLLSKFDYICQKANQINGQLPNRISNTKKELTKSWQNTMNKVYGCKLSVDGSFGPLSQAQANKHYLYKKAIAGLRIRNDYVRWLQNRLKELGYKISVDGSFWNDTDKVVRQFQKEHGLTVDGKVGANTIKKLLG